MPLRFKSTTERAVEEAFSFFSDDSSLASKHLLAAVRALGLPVTSSQLKEICSNKDETFDIDSFKDILVKIVERRRPENMANEIRKAFEALKDDNGKVLKRYLRNLLQNTGEKLTNEELSTLDKYPGDEITYSQFREIIEIPNQLDWTIVQKN